MSDSEAKEVSEKEKENKEEKESVSISIKRCKVLFWYCNFCFTPDWVVKFLVSAIIEDHKQLTPPRQITKIFFVVETWIVVIMKCSLLSTFRIAKIPIASYMVVLSFEFLLSPLFALDSPTKK